METDFTQAGSTIILSDIHLADAEPPHPHNPLWKRFKRPKHFVDSTFRRFLEHIHGASPTRAELILNGDIFDFDSVMADPRKQGVDDLKLTWLERMRGMAAEEAKSSFKMGVILSDHHVWVEALRDFILKGNRVVFIIGNHDIELHWPSVRQVLLSRLNLPTENSESVRFCEWFYLSNQDTLVEHGNQYDAFCRCLNPVNPVIKKGQRVLMRLPFGNLAGKYMLNGMGLMNPHVDSSFIKNSVREYVVFYYKYVMRTQPFLLWTWFWSAFVTLYHSVTEGLLPAMTDPLTIDSRVDDIAARSNSSARVLWSLRELHVHPAIFNPLKILQELWLDRAIFLALIVFISFQFFSILNVFVNVSIWWFIIPVVLLIPIFIFYARSVESENERNQRAAFERVPLIARIVRVKRVVHGHTHREQHTELEGVEYLNTGTWSPAYRDVECMQPFGRKCFAWIRAQGPGEPRKAALYEWTEEGPLLIPPDEKSAPSTSPISINAPNA